MNELLYLFFFLVLIARIDDDDWISKWKIVFKPFSYTCVHHIILLVWSKKKKNFLCVWMCKIPNKFWFDLILSIFFFKKNFLLLFVWSDWKLTIFVCWCLVYFGLQMCVFMCRCVYLYAVLFRLNIYVLVWLVFVIRIKKKSKINNNNKQSMWFNSIHLQSNCKYYLFILGFSD